MREAFNISVGWRADVPAPFDMRDDTIVLDEGEPRKFLGSIFPHTLSVMESVPRLWLNFHIEYLPPRPWPLTVGGLPITICTSSEGRGPLFPLMKHCNARISICTELDGTASNYYLSDNDTHHLVSVVDHYFRAHFPHFRLGEIIPHFRLGEIIPHFRLGEIIPHFRLGEIIITMQDFIYVVIDGPINISAVSHLLPGRIANCPVGYLHENEMHRPRRQDWKATRGIRPNPIIGVSDTTPYDTLRPGSMVFSEQPHSLGHRYANTTTSGVFIRNQTNQVFMTGASHSLGDTGLIYQWQVESGKRIIGKAVHEIACTNIAIIQLEEDIDFVNVIVEDEDGVVPSFTRLLGERPDDNTSRSKWPERTYLNSPFSGPVDGVVVAKSFKLETSCPAERHVRFTAYDWNYTGQVEGADRRGIPEGACGSAVWNNDGVIMGFFQYHITEGKWAGFCASVSATELGKAGYRLHPA